MKTKPITILLADNHLLIREGVKSLLHKNNQFKIVGEALEGKELPAKINSLKPDVIIIDYHLPGFFGTDDIKNIYIKSPGSKVLVVTTNDDKNDILKVLEYGVNNYILKQCDKEEFISAIHATAKNEKFFCGKVIDAIFEHRFPKNEHCEPAELTRREIDIVRMITRGMSNNEIAEKIFRSPHTISTHRKNIMKKLGLKKTSELILYAIRMNIIESPGK